MTPLTRADVVGAAGATIAGRPHLITPQDVACIVFMRELGISAEETAQLLADALRRRQEQG